MPGLTLSDLPSHRTANWMMQSTVEEYNSLRNNAMKGPNNVLLPVETKKLIGLNAEHDDAKARHALADYRLNQYRHLTAAFSGAPENKKLDVLSPKATAAMEEVDVLQKAIKDILAGVDDQELQTAVKNAWRKCTAVATEVKAQEQKVQERLKRNNDQERDGLRQSLEEGIRAFTSILQDLERRR